jgi:hypothetical protein
MGYIFNRYGAFDKNFEPIEHCWFSKKFVFGYFISCIVIPLLAYASCCLKLPHVLSMPNLARLKTELDALHMTSGLFHMRTGVESFTRRRTSSLRCYSSWYINSFTYPQEELDKEIEVWWTGRPALLPNTTNSMATIKVFWCLSIEMTWSASMLQPHV